MLSELRVRQLLCIQHRHERVPLTGSPIGMSIATEEASE